MATPESYFCLNGDVANGINPFRPGVDTLGGVNKRNDDQYLPDPDTMFTGPDFNQHTYLLTGLARVVPLVRIYIKIVGGLPTVYAVMAIGTVLATTDFTVTPAADGNFAITCPATKLPPPIFGGGVHCQTTSDFRGVSAVNTGGDGLEVRTRNSAGTLADVDCIVDWC
jgi:hypothetical protein